MRTPSTQVRYFDFSRPSTLKVVREYRQKYEDIDRLLEDMPEILAMVHADLKDNLSESRYGRNSKYTSEQILRALIVMWMEDRPYRDTVVQIEHSEFLRTFVRLGVSNMMNHAFLCTAFGSVRPETWAQVNALLTQRALATGKISGEKLRVDTTAVETNIHFPTDASLLWDGFRVLVREIRKIHDEYPRLRGRHRFHQRRVKRLYLFLARHGKSTSKRMQQRVRTVYGELGQAVVRVLQIAREYIMLLGIGTKPLELLDQYIPLVEQVINQMRRRVFNGEIVPASEKIYSIFEAHTELLMRGKAGKAVEFGHMVLVGQTGEKFISQYQVIYPRVTDARLVDPILESHKGSFGELPKVLSADKGFYESGEKLEQLRAGIPTVAIGVRGKPSVRQQELQCSDEFKCGQKFRAGVEGTISCLKRVYKQGRCLFRGIKHFEASLGCAVFCHNLVLLTRL